MAQVSEIFVFHKLEYVTVLSSGKTTATRILSQRLNAALTHTPPSCMHPLRTLYDNHVLRSAYYAFGNYIAAIQISDSLRKQPVVLDRYIRLGRRNLFFNLGTNLRTKEAVLLWYGHNLILTYSFRCLSQKSC